MSYFTLVDHRDRLITQGKLQLIRKGAFGQSTFRVVCPEGAEDELGVDRDPQQAPGRILRWS